MRKVKRTTKPSSFSLLTLLVITDKKKRLDEDTLIPTDHKLCIKDYKNMNIKET